MSPNQHLICLEECRSAIQHLIYLEECQHISISAFEYVPGECQHISTSAHQHLIFSGAEMLMCRHADVLTFSQARAEMLMC